MEEQRVREQDYYNLAEGKGGTPGRIRKSVVYLLREFNRSLDVKSGERSFGN